MPIGDPIVQAVTTSNAYYTLNSNLLFGWISSPIAEPEISNEQIKRKYKRLNKDEKIALLTELGVLDSNGYLSDELNPSIF